jgi:hypothetical protein
MYQRHLRYVRPYDAHHILNNEHAYGPSSNIMSLFKQANKGPLSNSFENFYIQSHYHHNNLFSEENTKFKGFTLKYIYVVLFVYNVLSHSWNIIINVRDPFLAKLYNRKTKSKFVLKQSSYWKFRSLYKVQCPTFNMTNDLLFHWLYASITSHLLIIWYWRYNGRYGTVKGRIT